jgi:general secretion pathway protein L
LSTLYIRVPSKAAADSVPHWMALPCPFALAARGDVIEREGSAALSDLSDAIGKAQRVVLLLAASDVTLLRLQVPPLSPARLKAALPSLVEDQLMSNPDECTIVAGPGGQDLRTVAVVNRGWLDILFNAMTSYGATRVHALPSQLCLPWQSGVASAAVTHEETDVELALRLSEHEGMGLPMASDGEGTAAEVVQMLSVLVAEAPITMYVSQAEVPVYREAVAAVPLLDQRITVYADNWTRWLAGAATAVPDLLADRNAAGAVNFDWRPWRWPLILAAVVLLANIVGLNIEWWRMKSEAAALNRTMTQTFKSAFPNEPLVVDAVSQMKQKIATARHDAGQLSPDDFLAMASAFGEAWQSTGASSTAIAALEYHNYSLLVKLKPGTSVAVDQLKASMAAHNLALSQPSANSLEIRSGK